MHSPSPFFVKKLGDEAVETWPTSLQETPDCCQMRASNCKDLRPGATVTFLNTNTKERTCIMVGTTAYQRLFMETREFKQGKEWRKFHLSKPKQLGGQWRIQIKPSVPWNHKYVLVFCWCWTHPGPKVWRSLWILCNMKMFNCGPPNRSTKSWKCFLRMQPCHSWSFLSGKYLCPHVLISWQKLCHKTKMTKLSGETNLPKLTAPPGSKTMAGELCKDCHLAVHLESPYHFLNGLAVFFGTVFK